MNKFALACTAVGRICDKIETVLSRKVIDLRSIFSNLDPQRTGLVSDAKFFNVVFNQVGAELGLCQVDAEELVKFFGKNDDRVNYEEFLKLVLPKDGLGVACEIGLEVDRCEQGKTQSQLERHQLNQIMTKIAYSCRGRGVHLEPYFVVRKVVSFTILSNILTSGLRPQL